MLTAGRLTKRVHLLRLVNTKDERGQDVAEWQTISKPWASVQMLKGDESVSALQIDATAKWKVIMRWRPDLTPADRIVYDDSWTVHTLSIVSITDKYERHEELEVIAGEVKQ